MNVNKLLNSWAEHQRESVLSSFLTVVIYVLGKERRQHGVSCLEEVAYSTHRVEGKGFVVVSR